MLKAEQIFDITHCADCGVTSLTARRLTQRLNVCRPIRQRERQLTESGPTWRTPSVAGVLRNLPFMRHAPPQALEVPCFTPFLCRFYLVAILRCMKHHPLLAPASTASSTSVITFCHHLNVKTSCYYRAPLPALNSDCFLMRHVSCPLF